MPEHGTFGRFDRSHGPGHRLEGRSAPLLRYRLGAQNTTFCIHSGRRRMTLAGASGWVWLTADVSPSAILPRLSVAMRKSPHVAKSKSSLVAS